MNATQLTSRTNSRTTIWLVSVSFVLFQFFLQLSSGVIINSIMTEMKLTALMTGFLSSSFYYVYTSLQIPVGILFDHKSTRHLLTFSAASCSLACFLFANSHTLTHLILARLLIGTGSSFAFVGVSTVIRQHFSAQQFTFMIGVSETLGFLVTMLGMFFLGNLVHAWGWRFFIQMAGVAGIFISLTCWLIIPNNHKNTTIDTPRHQPTPLHDLLQIIKNPLAWINGLFVALGFSIITVFAAMWAVPFLKIKLSCDLALASQLDAMLFMGVAVSCPLIGYLAGTVKKRRTLLVSSSLITAILLLLLLYLPTHSWFWCGLLLFLIGLCCGSYMIAYSISNEFAPPHAQSTAAGFTNTIATLSPLIQPLIGRFIDQLDAISPGASLQHYQYSLTILPLGLIIAAVLALYLPERIGPAHPNA